VNALLGFSLSNNVGFSGDRVTKPNCDTHLNTAFENLAQSVRTGFENVPFRTYVGVGLSTLNPYNVCIWYANKTFFGALESSLIF